jgi:hypothetical protein
MESGTRHGLKEELRFCHLKTIKQTMIVYVWGTEWGGGKKFIHKSKYAIYIGYICTCKLHIQK